MTNTGHECRSRMVSMPRFRRHAAVLRVVTLLMALAIPACRPSVSDLPYAERIRRAGPQDEMFKNNKTDSPVPPGMHAESLRCRFSRSIAICWRPPDLPLQGRAGHRDADVHGPAAADAPCRHAEVLAARAAARVTAFVEANDAAFNRLFVPFGDHTNGTETYAAGRYLDSREWRQDSRWTSTCRITLTATTTLRILPIPADRKPVQVPSEQENA